MKKETSKLDYLCPSVVVVSSVFRAILCVSGLQDYKTDDAIDFDTNE